MITKTIKWNRKIPSYTYLGCPLTKNESAWCFRICSPDYSGKGRCGRIAPHTLKGNIQQGIIDYKKKKRMETI